MRALRIVRPGVVEVTDVPVPEIGNDEVLVRVAGAGLCHSDLHVRHAPDLGGASWTLGHETAGHVAEVGASVSGFAAGDPVLVYLVWACGRCRACVDGRDNVCLQAGRTGMPPCPGLGPDGGMAEFVKVPARFLEPLGDLDPVTAGPLADAALTPMHAINNSRTRLVPGSTAVLIGLGGLGHVGLQILKATSAARVVAVDTDPDKLELARELGADEVLLADPGTADAVLGLTDGYGADVVLDFVGVQPAVDLAASLVAPDGALRFVGLGGGTLPYAVDGYATPVPWGVDVRTSYAGTRQDQRQVIALAQRGLLDVRVQRYALEDGVRAFDDLEAGRVTGRAVLVP